MADPILKVANLETYYGPIMAIRGVSFEVQAGSIVTILGSNGAGKTTVLKTVSGVMDPQKGTVLFEGREIQRMDPDKVMRLGMSHVPEGREVFPFLSVRENLDLGVREARTAGRLAWTLERIFTLFPILQERQAQPGTTLSGGEQQMRARQNVRYGATQVVVPEAQPIHPGIDLQMAGQAHAARCRRRRVCFIVCFDFFPPFCCANQKKKNMLAAP